jgi:hypothetical protein
MLDLFGGEVLTAFETAAVLRDKHLVRQLSNGKSFKFPATWRTTAGYVAPGTEITGNTIPHQDITIDVDTDPLIASVFVSDLDEMMNHYDVRAAYSKELGNVLARTWDANILRTILKAARSAALFTGDTGGSQLTSASYASDATTLFAGLSLAKQTMDAKDVPVDQDPLYAVLKPAQFYLLASSDRNLSRDYNGGAASIQNQALTTVDGVKIIKTNIAAAVYGVDSSADASLATYYKLNCANSIGAVFTPDAVATAMVKDVQVVSKDQPEKQGTLFISRLMLGTRTLRTKCAVELKVA